MAIKNYLKDVKDITAPLNWKSSPDSPPTQLAYITKPEVDLLVKANLHGSMNGKPNKGPKGIMSLDGLGEEDTAYDDAVDKSGNEAAIDSYFYNTGGGGNDNNNSADNIIDNVANWQEENKDNENIYTGEDIKETTKNQATAEGIALSQPKEEEPKKFSETFDFSNYFEKFSIPLNLAKGIGALIQNLIVNPKPEQFTNPNDLSIIRSLMLDDKGNVDPKKVSDYYDEYKDIIDEGMGIGSFKDADGMGLSDAAQLGSTFEDIIMSASPTGVEGMESERRLDPVGFFTNEDGSFNIPQTSGQAVTMAESLTFDDIMNSSLSGAEKRRLSAALMEARELASQDRGQNIPGAGVGGGTYVPPVTPPIDPTNPTNPNPTLPITLPPNTTPKFPGSVVTDYTQLGLPNIYGNQEIPNYGNFYQGQGGQPVGLQNYLDTLRNRFGIG